MSEEIIRSVAEAVFEKIKDIELYEERLADEVNSVIIDVLTEMGAEAIEVDTGVYDDTVDTDKGYIDVDVEFILDGKVVEGEFKIEYEKSYYFGGEIVDPEEGDGIDYVIESSFGVSCTECECDWERYSDDHIGVSVYCSERGEMRSVQYSGEIWLDVYAKPAKLYLD